MKRQIDTWLVVMGVFCVASCASNVGAAAWTPSSTTTLAWYDAADVATISTNDAAGAVSQWNDKSGNGYHASSVGSNQPATGSTTLNGLNTVSFDGTNDVLTSSSSNSLPVSMFVVVKNPGAGQFVYVSGVGLGMGGAEFGEAGSNFLGVKEGKTWLTTSEPVATSGTILGQIYPSGSAPTLFFQNGNSVIIDTGEATIPNASTVSVSIGNGGSRSPDVEIAEVIVLDREAPADVRQRIEGYLAWKWGLEDELPANHPYTNSAPVELWFEDLFEGSGSASSPGSFGSDATDANAKVSDYIVDIGAISILDNASVGNPKPGLNLFNGQTQSTDGTNAFHLNLTTVWGATYTVACQASMWGSDTGTRSYTLSAEAFDGADTITGTALGSDLIEQPSASFTTKNISFTFVAESTATTLYFDGTIGDTFNHNVWIDNLEIQEDLSTRKYSGTVIIIE